MYIYPFHSSFSSSFCQTSLALPSQLLCPLFPLSFFCFKCSWHGVSRSLSSVPLYRHSSSNIPGSRSALPFLIPAFTHFKHQLPDASRISQYSFSLFYFFSSASFSCCWALQLTAFLLLLLSAAPGCTEL